MPVYLINVSCLFDSPFVSLQLPRVSVQLTTFSIRKIYKYSKHVIKFIKITKFEFFYHILHLFIDFRKLFATMLILTKVLSLHYKSSNLNFFNTNLYVL